MTITTVGGPHCAHRVSGSREQTTADEEATVAQFFANKVLQYLKKTATRGLMFRMGVINWHLGDICDASHAEHCERTGDPHRSLKGRMTILVTRSLDQADCRFLLIACTSNTLKRVWPFNSHRRDKPNGIGRRSRRSAASRGCGHV